MAWTLDAAHSAIQFSVKHLMISTVRGSFKSFTGELNLDSDHPEKSVIAGTIEVSSITTGEAQRDGHLQSPDFFDVAKYPKISYQSTRIVPDGQDKFKVYGQLTIKGVTKEIVLEAESAGFQKSPFGTTAWGVSATGSLNRKDFDLSWNVALEAGGFLVGDVIKFTLDAEFVKQPEVVATQTA